jgi:hypothetical protein
MRYHSDPLYSCWTTNTAVVSIGCPRRFAWRAIDNFSHKCVVSAGQPGQPEWPPLQLCNSDHCIATARKYPVSHPPWCLPACRWVYSVSAGDVVVMTGDCQLKYQHSLLPEKAGSSAARVGPRMSLVFKQRVPGTVP